MAATSTPKNSSSSLASPSKTSSLSEMLIPKEQKAQSRGTLISLWSLCKITSILVLCISIIITLMPHMMSGGTSQPKISKKNGNAVRTHFVNLMKMNVEVRWVGYNGTERPWFVVSIGKDEYIQSYPGNVWRFYNNDTKEWLFDEETRIGPNGCTTVHMIREENYRRELFEYCERNNGRSWINVYPREKAAFPGLPAQSIGERRKIATTHIHPNGAPGLLELEIQTVSLEPRAFIIDGFLTDYECEHIIQAANSSFERSVTVAGISDVRTSSTAWLEVAPDPVLVRVSQRIFDVLGIPYPRSKKIAEKLQVLRYEQGQQYQPHNDYFDLYSRGNASNNRMITSFMYLSGGEGTDLIGGETVFPTAGRSSASEVPCANDFRVAPKRGRLLIFYSMLDDGNLDVYSKHGGCPITEGVKYASNFWIWDKYFESPE